jgi:hypothetical protein
LQRAAQGHQSTEPIFIDFRNDIQRIYQNPSQRITLEYFDLLKWVDSRIRQKSDEQLKSAG